MECVGEEKQTCLLASFLIYTVFEEEDLAQAHIFILF